MKPKHLLMTTALAAALAGPAATQETGTEQTGIAESLQGYSVADFMDLSVMTNDGAEVGAVDAVIEADDGARVLLDMDGRRIAVPLEAFRLAEEGEALVVSRSMDDLRGMDAYAPAGEVEFGADMQMSEAMDSAEAAEVEQLNTNVVEESPEDVTVLTTEPDDPADVTAPSEEGETMAEAGAAGNGAATEATGAAEMAADDVEQPVQPSEDAEMASDAPASDDTAQETEAAETAPTEGADLGQLASFTVGEVVGMHVVTTGGRIGEIDYVVRGDDGSPEGVIGIGGFLGLGEYTVALPLSEFELVADESELMVDQTEDALRSNPEFDEWGVSGVDDDVLVGSIGDM